MVKPSFPQTASSSSVPVIEPENRVGEPAAAVTKPALANVLSTRKSLFIAVAIGAALSLTAVGALTLVNTKKPAAAKAADNAVLTVTVETPRLQSLDDMVSLTGSVSAWDPLTIGTEITGLRIQSVEVEEGDHVVKGQVLARLNAALLQAQLLQAKARLASSEATLKKAIQPNRPEQIQALKAALQEASATTEQEEAHCKQARVNFNNALNQSRRYAKLAHVGAVSFEEAENKQVAADSQQDELLGAEAKVRALKSVEAGARQRLAEAERGGRREDIDISKATIAEMRGQIDQLAEQIRQTVIVAPDDGLISKREAHIGDIASAGKTLFSMIRMDRLEARAEASDIDLTKFRVGQDVTVSTTEGEHGHIIGKVALIGPQVDASTRLGVVRIDLPADCGLKPGMFVRGEVNLGKRMALTVPAEAVVTREGQSFVFTLEDNRAVSRSVKVGNQSDTFSEISSGLSPKEPIIVKGARFISDRDLVRVVPGESR